MYARKKVYWAEAVWCVSSKLCKSIHFHKITKVFVKVNICQKICKKEVKCCNWGKKVRWSPHLIKWKPWITKKHEPLTFFWQNKWRSNMIWKCRSFHFSRIPITNSIEPNDWHKCWTTAIRWWNTHHKKSVPSIGHECLSGPKFLELQQFLEIHLLHCLQPKTSNISKKS